MKSKSEMDQKSMSDKNFSDVKEDDLILDEDSPDN
jgi:hypothetical protein